jgi:hypothetical protein
MTYKKEVPRKVFDRWTALNPDYTIDFSLDKDCYDFLKTEYNDEVATLFQTIPRGMHKADLWRIFKLYKHGGVYADVDLVPYMTLNTYDPTVFYSCMAINNKSVFQAFIMSPPKNPLILHFMISFLVRHPYRPKNGINGPCNDMYNCIKYNTGSVASETPYTITNVKIPMLIDPSTTSIQTIPLVYFPDDVTPTFKMNTDIPFNVSIQNSVLTVEKCDGSGWDKKYICEIILDSSKVYLFKEKGRYPICNVFDKNKKVLDSRDPEYSKNKGW